MNNMNEIELNAYFDQCLEQCQAKLKLLGPKIQPRSAGSAVELPIDRDELNAAIMGSGIVGFLEGMTRRNKRIVKNTYAYADIASRVLFSEKVARYECFKKLMFATGWTQYLGAFTQYKSSTSKLTMDNVALDIVHSAIGGVAGPAGSALKVVAGKTIEALKKQPDAVKLFERHAIEASGANFGISVCKQDDDAEVTMAVGTVRYDTSANNTKVIFVEWNSSDVEIYQGKALFTIHEEDLRKEAECIKFLDDLREAIFMEFSPV
ncbi:hypothetical protein [Pseudomonas frederiksbergensis]|uniref:Uncharacterized protein n=1 Tax=Pseudomonas frederiksbergensis TaxID=104087 RepID=A0A423HPN5_9PSED|nr:hypothetical protein [Pseudomonas frederiksbergensis]RON15161.1 hypothetical protein BK662_13695 [Pseudomonas frederiksbergensis]